MSSAPIPQTPSSTSSDSTSPQFHTDTSSLRNTFNLAPMVERLLMHIYQTSSIENFMPIKTENGDDMANDSYNAFLASSTQDTNALLAQLLSKYQNARTLLTEIPHLNESVAERQNDLVRVRERVREREIELERLRGVLRRLVSGELKKEDDAMEED